MARRILVPVALLVAAALSLAAVFVVQRLEARGGPLSEPYADLAFSPTGDGVRDEALLRFNPRGTQTVTVRVVDEEGTVVRTLFEDVTVSTDFLEPWDGRTDAGAEAPNGTYRFEIHRKGDRRTYAPSKPTVLDRTPPRARLDKIAYAEGVLTGLFIAPRGTKLVMTTAPIDDPDAARAPKVLPGLRAWRPAADTVSGTPTSPPVRGQVVTRFAIPLRLEQILSQPTIYAADGADNRTELHGSFVVTSNVELDVDP